MPVLYCRKDRRVRTLCAEQGEVSYLKLLYLLETARTARLNESMYTITQLGGVLVFVVLTLAIFWCVDRRCGLFLMTAGLAGTLLGQALKLLLHIPRPWVLDPGFSIVERARAGAGGFSCPSGHTINAAVTYGGLACWTRRRWMRLVFVLLMLLVAFSRMYLGVHTPLDVGAGLLVGGAAVLACYPLFSRWGDRPAAQRAALCALLALTAAGVLYMALWPWGTDVRGENLAEGVKNAWMLFGAAAGLLLASLGRGGIRFSTVAPFWKQVLKLVPGLLLVGAVEELLRAVAGVSGMAAGPAHALRALGAVWFAAGVWPRTFARFSRRKA